ncbi:MAG: glycosyltransferase family 9 protein [Longimicrobiales bacterium]
MSALPAEALDGHIAIVLLTGLGDVVHGLPVVNALKRAHPRCRITWIVEPMPAGILDPHPAIDRVVVFEKSRGWRGVRDLARTLSGERFDLALNFNIYFKSIFPTVLTRAPHRLGFDRGRARDGVWLFANHHLARGPRRHTQDLFLEFLDVLGVPAHPLSWRLTLTRDERAAQARFFAPFADRPMVGVVPASANPKKDWPAERYIELVGVLERDLRVHTLLIGGPGPRETAIARRIVEESGASPAWGLGDGVRRLIWLAGGCRAIVAPDTGPVHIGRALEVPVVGLYGHTNPWRVGPYGRYEELWLDSYNEPGAAPDASVADPQHGRMERIAVSDVDGRVERALQVHAPRE